MKVIIAGSRKIGRYTDWELVKLVADAVVRSGFEVTCVVSGGARGIDLAGETWAESKGIGIVRYPAEWDKFGKAAGMIRNREMADNADALIAVWDGSSSGTAGMVREAAERGLKVYVYRADLLGHDHIDWPT